MLLYTATPRCLRRVPIGDTGVHRLLLGSYRSTVNLEKKVHLPAHYTMKVTNLDLYHLTSGVTFFLDFK